MFRNMNGLSQYRSAESRVQSPESRVQSPESRVEAFTGKQLLEAFTGGIYWRHFLETFPGGIYWQGLQEFCFEESTGDQRHINGQKEKKLAQHRNNRRFSKTAIFNRWLGKNNGKYRNLSFVLYFVPKMIMLWVAQIHWYIPPNCWKLFRNGLKKSFNLQTEAEQIMKWNSVSGGGSLADRGEVSESWGPADVWGPGAGEGAPAWRPSSMNLWKK